MNLTSQVKYFSLLLIFTLSFSFTFADDLGISQFPDSPREGEEVKLTLSSDKYDLNKATITWSIDGVEVDSGVGRKTLTMRTTSSGLAQIILVNVEQEGFNPAQMQKVVEANTNFILYEGADSYVPSFYKGRRLPPREGTVRVAFFSFKDGDIVGLNNTTPDTYTWRVNGEDRPALSGQNKIINNILTKVTDTALSLRIIKEDSNGSKKFTEATVPLQNSEIVLYKTDEKKLLKQLLSDTEVGRNIYLLVEPFFFSVPNKSSTILGYKWKLNDIETKVTLPWSVSFTGKDTESVKLNVEVINNQKITQDGSRGFTFKVQ